MTRPVLVLRPQPGADATGARARAMGLEPVIAPLFGIVPREWEWPGSAEALLVTSANAARMIGAGPDRTLLVYVVGKATAAALRERGFERLIVGDAGVAELVERAASDGVRHLLHLTGEHRTEFDPGSVRIDTCTIYASEEVAPKPEFYQALERGAVAMLHSPRAARRFAQLAGAGHPVAALSRAVLAAAGPWTVSALAEQPTDDALLAAAARLCQG